MSIELDTIEAMIRGLSLSDRNRLIRRLIAELDGPPEADTEEAWVAEIERRAREMDGDETEAISPEDLKARLRAHRRS